MPASANNLNGLDREQRYWAQQLADMYRRPERYSGAFKTNLYDLAARDPAIHYEALKLNRSKRNRMVVGG